MTPDVTPACRAILAQRVADLERRIAAMERDPWRGFGAKGARARSAAMTPEQRSAAARKAAQARWGKPR